MMAKGELNPGFLVIHIAGLDTAAQTTIDLDKIHGS